MPRGRRDMDEAPDLDLRPFMNLVVILIPMLLLAIAFIKIGVVNITAPKLATGPATTQPPKNKKKPLNLTVTVSPKGFYIAATAATLPPMSGCPVPGPTICLRKQSVDVAAKFDKARAALAAGRKEDGEKLINEGMAAYNFRELYNQLVKIKKQFPDETIVNISGDPDTPFAMIVRTMDVARFKLDHDSYSSDSKFWAADYAKKGKKFELLFNDPVLAVVQ